MEKRRNVCVSLLKFIALFLMIWGHCIQKGVPSGVDFFQNKVYQVIYSFHMPLFMLISGYLFYFSYKKRDLKTLLVVRSKPLIMTIVFFGGIFTFLFTEILSELLKGNFSIILDNGGGWINSLTYLWFLWTVLYCSAYVGIVCKKVKNKYLKTILLLFGFVGCFFVPNATLNVYMYPYFVIGFCFCRYKDTELMKKLVNLRFLSLILFPIMLCFYSKKFFTVEDFILKDYSLIQNIYIYFFRYTIGLVGSLFMITIVKAFLDCFIKDKQVKCLNVLAKVGDNSLQVYAISTLLVSWYFPVIIKVINKTFLANTLLHIQNSFFLYNFIFTFICAIAYMVIVQLVSFIFNKTRVSCILFGKEIKK